MSESSSSSALTTSQCSEPLRDVDGDIERPATAMSSTASIKRRRRTTESSNRDDDASSSAVTAAQTFDDEQEPFMTPEQTRHGRVFLRMYYDYLHAYSVPIFLIYVVFIVAWPSFQAAAGESS